MFPKVFGGFLIFKRLRKDVIGVDLEVRGKRVPPDAP